MNQCFSYTGERLVKLSGVYSIIHRDTGMIYVGSSSDMSKRVERHLRDARLGGLNTPLYRAVRMFGAGAFDFEVLERCQKENNKEREDFYITLFNSASMSGLNVLSKSAARNYSHQLSESTRERMRIAQLGKKRSPETCAKIGAIHRGRKRTPETCERIRLANIGRKHTESAKAKVSAANLGKIISPEVRKRMSDALRGIKKSEQGRANIRAAKQNVTIETRLKMSASQKARRERELLV